MSGTQLPILSVQITAKDSTGPAFDQVNQRLTRTGAASEKAGQAVAKLGDTNGLSRLSEGFQGLRSTAFDAFRSVDRIAPALGAITGAASIAGMTALVARWSQLGQQTYLTGQRLGLPTDRLTALRGAARLAGASAEDLDGGMAALDERLRGATFGRDGDAIQTFNALGVKFGDIGKKARGAGDAFGDVADGIKKLYDSGEEGRGAALRAAQKLGLESLFPLLIKGKAGIQALQADVARLGGVIPPEAAKRADELQTSFSRLGIAVEGVATRLGDKWGAAVKPYVDGTTDWIAKNKELADSYTTIGVGILALGAIKPAAWLARLLGIGALVPAAALALPLALHGDTDAGATPEGFRKDWVPDNDDSSSMGARIGRAYRRYAPTWAGGAPAENPQPAAPATPGALSTALGISLPQYEAFRGGVAAKEGARYDQMGGSSNRFAGRYQMGGDEIRQTAQSLGEAAPSQAGFLADAAMQERYFAAYTAGHHRSLMQTSPQYVAATPEQRLKVLAYAHNQGAGGAATWLNTGVDGKDAFGTAGSSYATEVGRRLRQVSSQPPAAAVAVPPAAAAAPPAVAPSAPGIASAAAPVPQAWRMADRTQAAAAAVPIDGKVAVTVELKGAPVGTTARATATGAAQTSPPRIETAMQGVH